MSKQVWKSLLAGLSCVTLGGLNAQAATMRFTPAGSQLDSDSIFDIELMPGQTITFSNYFDNSSDFTTVNVPIIGPVTTPRPTRFIDYVINYDPNELTYVSSVLDVLDKVSNSCIIGGPCGSSIVTAMGSLSVSHRTSLTSTIAPQSEFLLDQITFTGNNVEKAPGNGISDYDFSGSNRGLLSANISSFNSNIVEVQHAPGPLPLLGTAAAFSWSRKLRRRVAGLGSSTDS
jgi:hypothetical protein